MTIATEVAPEVEQILRTRAEAMGLTLEDYLPPLVAIAVQQEEWDGDDASQATIAGSAVTLRRL